MASKEEDKFLVLNSMKLSDLFDKWGIEIERGVFSVVKGEDEEKVQMVEGFLGVLNFYNMEYGDKAYVVVNQDEPYAEAVWDIIIAFETMKEKPQSPPMPPSSEGGSDSRARRIWKRVTSVFKRVTSQGGEAHE